MIKTNENRLVKFRVQGSIKPPANGGWRVGYDGVARVLPGTGAITLNLKVGDLAGALEGDHLEPGVTSSMEVGPDAHSESPRNQGYNTYSCVGNIAEIITGKAKGKKGIVTGHHGGCEHVLIDFDDKTLLDLTYDDKIMITSHGVGLRLEEFPDIEAFSLDPQLLQKMNLKNVNGKLEVPVTTIVPAVAMGSGLGDNRPYKGDYDIQTSDPETNVKYGLDKLKLGDIVAIVDHDSTRGWSYRQGAVSIGIIIHGESYIAGHGPGCQTLLSSKDGNIIPKISLNANIGRYLKIGRFRGKKK